MQGLFSISPPARRRLLLLPAVALALTVVGVASADLKRTFKDGDALTGDELTATLQDLDDRIVAVAAGAKTADDGNKALAQTVAALQQERANQAKEKTVYASYVAKGPEILAPSNATVSVIQGLKAELVTEGALDIDAVLNISAAEANTGTIDCRLSLLVDGVSTGELGFLGLHERGGVKLPYYGQLAGMTRVEKLGPAVHTVTLQMVNNAGSTTGGSCLATSATLRVRPTH